MGTPIAKGRDRVGQSNNRNRVVVEYNARGAAFGERIQVACVMPNRHSAPPHANENEIVRTCETVDGGLRLKPTLAEGFVSWHHLALAAEERVLMASRLNRRRFLGTMAGAGALTLYAGCAIEREPAAAPANVELVWGVHGTRAGRLHKPRVVGIDASDRLYIADLTDRIQVFDRDGNYERGWRTPGLNVDGPSGVSVDSNGEVLVADTHFYRVLVYGTDGTLHRQVGDGVQGSTPGRFGYPTDAVRDRRGNYYVAEYGDFDRVQVFDPEGAFIRQWGGHGYEPGEFLRPRALLIDDRDHLYVADSCNHRIQVFDLEGSLLHTWGRRGAGLGEFSYPYDLALGPDDSLYVCEYGNSRVQKFSREGRAIGVWGRPGRGAAELDNPCALILDSQGAVHVVDSGNHRVQRFRM